MRGNCIYGTVTLLNTNERNKNMASGLDTLERMMRTQNPGTRIRKLKGEDDVPAEYMYGDGEHVAALVLEHDGASLLAMTDGDWSGAFLDRDAMTHLRDVLTWKLEQLND